MLQRSEPAKGERDDEGSLVLLLPPAAESAFGAPRSEWTCPRFEWSTHTLWQEGRYVAACHACSRPRSEHANQAPPFRQSLMTKFPVFVRLDTAVYRGESDDAAPPLDRIYLPQNEDRDQETGLYRFPARDLCMP